MNYEEEKEELLDEVDETEVDEDLDEAEDLEPDEAEGEDEVDESVEEPEEDKVPLKTLLETKKQLKEYKKQLRELKEKEQSQDLVNYKEKTKKKYVSMGYDEDLAEALAEDLAEQRSLIASSKVNSVEEEYLEDIKDLAMQGYDDAIQYKDEIINYIKKFKKIGEDIDVEDAYFRAKKTTKQSATKREMRTQIEQQEAIKRRKSSVGRKIASSSSAPKGHGLSDDDKATLKNLKEVYPDRDWSPKKFAEFKKMMGL